MAQSDNDRDVKAGLAGDAEQASGGVTRRSFLAKAGLAAGAIGLAGTIPTLAAGCGSSSGNSSSGSSGASTGEPSVIRFVFAPDPVWNFMQDTGIVAKWEENYNFRIVNTTTWDETAWFIGGHADIASMGTYEVPMVAENAGKEFISFGVYNLMRDSIFVRSESPYKTMEDLKGQRISTAGTGASMLMYAAMFKKQYGVDLKLGGGDYKMSVQEFPAMPAALSKGDVEASFGLIDFEIPYVKSGEHRWLYPDQPTGYEWYQTYLDPSAVRHVACNLWVTTPAWLDANAKAAEGFNLMWQEGVNGWYADKKTIIQAYPDLFTTTNEAEVDWFLNYLNEDGGMHDQCVKSVYIDPTWAQNETAVFTLLKEQGFVKETTPNPLFKTMAPPADAPPEAQPPASSSPAPSPSV
jgi:ABC-type nitrate/sulfonate/bicarbonate transport system substrate-binding protein